MAITVSKIVIVPMAITVNKFAIVNMAIKEITELIPLTHEYMITRFPYLVQALQ
jgi:hypothetical protein